MSRSSLKSRHCLSAAQRIEDRLFGGICHGDEQVIQHPVGKHPQFVGGSMAGEQVVAGGETEEDVA
jgi:hypothetical protein